MSTVNEITGLPVIEEEDASPEVAQIYQEIKRDMHLPFVPNIYKTVAVSPGTLKVQWAVTRAMFQYLTLPEALVSIIFYAVARANNCQYCSAGHEASCRMLGIDEEILQQVAHDLGRVSPERVRAILEFALLVSHEPQAVSRTDYDRLREYGIPDNEIIEIVFLAGMGHMGDTIADSLKVEVDTPAGEMLTP